MTNSTEIDFSLEQELEVASEPAPISLSSLELDLVGGGGPISVFL